MNNYSRAIITQFLDIGNYHYLFDALSKKYDDKRVDKHLDTNLYSSMKNYTSVIQSDLQTSRPLPGMTIDDQIRGFDYQFFLIQTDYIQEYVLHQQKIPIYTVTDGLPTSTHQHCSADDMLKSWLHNPGRNVQAREDQSGDLYKRDIDGAHSGITFCDQSHLGTQNHVDMYENTLYKRALNTAGYENTAFGVSTIASDNRLLGRSTFRKNEAGVENGIPRYETRLQKRNLERNVSEGLRDGGQERGNIILGHDMESLYRRVDYKNNVRDRYRGQDHPLHMNLSPNVPPEYRYL